MKLSESLNISGICFFLALKALSTNLGTMVDPQEMQVESHQEQVPNDKALDGQE